MDEYNLVKSIFQETNDTSKEIKKFFSKAGLYSIQCWKNHDFYKIEEYCYVEDSLLEMSLNNQYSDIVCALNINTNELEKAYYYSLIYRLSDELTECMKKIETTIKEYDYHDLSIQQKVNICRVS